MLMELGDTPMLKNNTATDKALFSSEKCWCLSYFSTKTYASNEYPQHMFSSRNKKIICGYPLLSVAMKQKHMLWVLIKSAYPFIRSGSERPNEYPQHYVLWRNKNNRSRIITKYSSLTIPLWNPYLHQADMPKFKDGTMILELSPNTS